MYLVGTSILEYFYWLQLFNIPYFFSWINRLPTGRHLVAVLNIVVQISGCLNMYYFNIIKIWNTNSSLLVILTRFFFQTEIVYRPRDKVKSKSCIWDSDFETQRWVYRLVIIVVLIFQKHCSLSFWESYDAD